MQTGIDDGWMKCGNYGVERYRYHDTLGAPVVDSQKFPSLQAVADLAHSLNLTAGWYGNACGCAAQPYPQCCSDHCDTLECFTGDINATLAFGFDSYKLDGCGAQRDIELWAHMFNHSVTLRRQMAKPGSRLPDGIMLENCHDDDGMALGPDGTGGNSPYYSEDGEFWCPFHTYRTSGDARPTYGTVEQPKFDNIHGSRNLSVPGCWAYADMMEVGVTATGGLHDCGPNGTDKCLP